ncbi:3-keto-5-aminohexanoate cleavage protein [Hydrogenophaga sp.]
MNAHTHATPDGAQATQPPVVICVAPNGARRTRKDHPALPMTAAELGAEAAACLAAGATVMHLHVRNEQGSHSLDVDRYRAAIDSVHACTQGRLLVQVTTEAVGIYQPAEQMEVVQRLKPAAASVAIRELVPHASAHADAARFFEWCALNRVALQFIVYTPQEAATLQQMARRGELGCDRPNALFVLGRYTEGQRSSATDVLPFLAAWDNTSPWSVCAFGPTEALCMTAAMGLGGHVRVGFENNLQRADGSTALNNADLVSNVAAIARHSGRGVAGLEDALRLYGASAC